MILLNLDYYILLRCDISPCKVTILHVYSLTERIWLNWFMNGIELMFQELVPCDWHLPSDVPSPCFDWREPQWRSSIGGVSIIGHVSVTGGSGGTVLKYKVHVIWGYYYLSVESLTVNVRIITPLLCDSRAGFNSLSVIWRCQ